MYYAFAFLPWFDVTEVDVILVSLCTPQRTSIFVNFLNIILL